MTAKYLLTICLSTISLFLLGSAVGSADWTAMLYLDGDNNLEYYAGVEMNEVNASDADVDCLVLKDDWGTNDARLYHVRNGTVTQMSAEWLKREVNMGSGATLRDFVSWSLENYPSENTLLTMWDHGGSFVGCCVDSTNGSDMLRIPETRAALDDALAEGERISVIGYADCLMASVEVAYELVPVADLMVGSEKVGWAYGSYGIPWDFDDILEYMADTDDPSDVAAFIVEDAMELTSGMKYQSHTWSAIDLSGMDSLAAEVDALAEAVTEAFDVHHVSVILDRMVTETYEGPYGGWFDRIIDLYHLCENLHGDTDLPSAVRTAASNVMDELNATIIAEDHWTAWSGYDEPCDHAHGLSINFPDIRSRIWTSYATKDGAQRWTTDSVWDEFLSLYCSYIFVDDDASGTMEGSYEHPYQGVQYALDRTRDGDTLRVLDGTYSGQATVTDGLRIIGNGSSTSSIGGTGTGLNITAADVSIEGIGLSGYDVGILSRADGLTLRNVTFSGLGKAIVLATSAGADARYCDWDGADETAIRDLVRDGTDRAGLGVVAYSPWYDDGALVHADVTPPSTGDDHDDLWHNVAVTVNLDPYDGTSRINWTYWRVDGGAWQTGTEVIVPADDDHSDDGVHFVDFFSVDVLGNVEPAKNVSVRIDTICPSLDIRFDAEQGRVCFGAKDLLDGSPSKAVCTSGTQRRFTLTDHAGNELVVKLFYSSYEANGWSFRKVVLSSVKENGGSWHSFTAGERFAIRFQASRDSLLSLVQIVCGDGWRVDATYDGTADSTTIVVQDSGSSSSSVDGVATVSAAISETTVGYDLP